MAVTKEKKAEILKELVDKFGKSKTVAFADYRGLDVASMSELRGKLREGNAEAKIAKKTLIKLAAKENKIDELPADVMEGPVAAIFSYEDELSGIQILYKFSKGNKNVKLLGGIIDGVVVGSDVVTQYAKLPSRDELLAKLVGSMKSPISGTVGILGNLIGGFVRVLGAYKDTLPTEAVPEPAKEEKAKTAPAADEESAAETEIVEPAAEAEPSESTEQSAAESTEPAESAEEDEAEK